MARIQDDCHHQVKWEWMSLSQIELVWVRVRMERECFWVNLREDNKVSESKMAVAESSEWQNSRWLPSSSWVRMNEFESDWISLSQSQNGVRVFWVNLREDNKVSESKMAVSESKMAEFKMAAIIKLNQNEWVWVSWTFLSQSFELNPRWLNPIWQNSRWLPSLS